MQCKICGKDFSKIGFLKKHMLSHTEEKPFPCEVCHKSFAQEAGLKQHLLSHGGGAGHTCEICGKAFKRMGNLEKHVVSHSGSLPYNCDICGKQFLQLGSYKRHALAHSSIVTDGFSGIEGLQTDDDVSTNSSSENFATSLSGSSWIVNGDQIIIKSENLTAFEDDTSAKNEETFMILINNSNIGDITGDVIEAI